LSEKSGLTLCIVTVLQVSQQKFHLIDWLLQSHLAERKNAIINAVIKLTFAHNLAKIARSWQVDFSLTRNDTSTMNISVRTLKYIFQSAWKAPAHKEAGNAD